ncbi:MAG TPA: NADH-quinone oxidoreductase subunit N [Polyangia bacterium]|nr:NADH-quinone oxidoreductase subunit N [Polyangia bacterium]
MSFDPAQIAAVLPLLVLSLAGCGLLLTDAFTRGRSRGFLMWLALAAVGVAFILVMVQWRGFESAQTAFGGMVVLDHFALYAQMVFLTGGALTLLLAPAYLHEHGLDFGEFYPLVLFALAGMSILAQAGDLVTILLGIETMSLSVYVLTGCWRRSPKSEEGALKYYLNGAVATAFLVYGIALIYGATGETNLRAIASQAAGAAGQPTFILGMLLTLVALGFKVAAAPFHMWAPDAYEGAPTPVTAFMAAAVKAAAFVAVLRVLVGALGTTELKNGSLSWVYVLSGLSVLTMTVGNLAALRQENVKRLLAYSSIAHAGYLLVGVVAAGVVGAEGRAAVLYYLLAYTFTTIGAFGVVAWIGRRGDERLLLDDWGGLGTRHPAAALAMTIFLLSLGGIPPTAGFFGKFYIFKAALESSALLPLVVIAVLNSVISIYYYLKVVMVMYFREAGRETVPLRSAPVTLALVVAAFFVLQMGLQPGRYLAYAAKSLLGG